jgi:hypothetical protein
LVADDLEQGRLVRLLPQYRPVEFSMNAVYPHRHHLSAKVRSFIDLLVHHSVEHQRLIDPCNKCGPDWDITTPELKAAWEQGRKDLFHPYGKTYAQTIGEQDLASDHPEIPR